MSPFIKSFIGSVIAGVAVLVAGFVMVPSAAHAASCGRVGSAGAFNIKTTRVSCADARRFVRIWSNSCRGQGQGTLTNCVLGLPSRPRLALNCVGKFEFGGVTERCFTRNRRYRINFDADL